MALAETQINAQPMVEPKIATPTLTVTVAAAEAVRGLMTQRNLEDHALRVFVQGGGCSGFQYGMALESTVRDSDMVFDQHGVRVVVDEVSIGYLRGANIDYVNDVMASGFKIDNPNASSACGCGNSFRTDGQDAPEHHGASGCGCGGHDHADEHSHAQAESASCGCGCGH
ncbi:MAG TPA: iron-sulfur cluster insertion protein ErpA [Anaerolineales bacterium]|nr:iron-sulfur cluster insertion protein ErpA [Anaerolineales bacterium]HRQ92931.1 iron-sulfur cluster insertion protein ErpA [Anaerolineales bacterium]